MHAKQALRRAADHVAGNDFVPRGCQPLRRLERSFCILGGNDALTFATSDSRSELHRCCPPSHDLRILLIQLEQPLTSWLIGDEREDCGRIPVSHRWISALLSTLFQ